MNKSKATPDERPGEEKEKSGKGPKKTNVPSYRDRPEDLPDYEDQEVQEG